MANVWCGNFRVSAISFADNVVRLVFISTDNQCAPEQFLAECEALEMTINLSKFEVLSEKGADG